MTSTLEEILDTPGQVQIDNLVLISFRKNNYLDITDYLIELNLFESIFNPFLTGDILLTDSRNLIREFGLVGGEYLSITLRTPTFPTDKSISKIFRVSSLEDKTFIKDGSTLVYKLTFTSIEMFQDLLNPIYRAYEGKPEEIIKTIYEEYLMTNRNVRLSDDPVEDAKTPLTFFGETSNTLKFVSPGWSPLQCINWTCSKTLPANEKSANFLFWETTKGFYFGNLDTIFNKPEVASIGTYVYSSPRITALDENDIANLTFMFNIRSLKVQKVFDQLQNLMAGYISNRVINVDIVNKGYENVDYDHGENFNNYSHLEKKQAVPFFDETVESNPSYYRKVNFSNPGLHSGFLENFSEKEKNIWGNRRSNMIELANFRMELVIPGRTDIECGQTIYVKLPKKNPGGLIQESKNFYQDDDMYSGYYLITSLNHKINTRTHFITMSVTKDSLSYEVLK